MSEHATSSGCLSPRDAADLDARDVSAALGGDRTAFDALVRRHQQAVINTTYYLLGDYQDALEAAQETFLSAYKGLSGFLGRSAFRTWLLRIATNTARSLHGFRRAKKRSGPRISLSGTSADEEGPRIEIPDESHSPEGLLLRKEVKEALEEAIARLEPAARDLIVLRDLNGESYEAIARSLQLPLGTVKSKVHRARLELRDAMRKYL